MVNKSERKEKKIVAKKSYTIEDLAKKFNTSTSKPKNKK